MEVIPGDFVEKELDYEPSDPEIEGDEEEEDKGGVENGDVVMKEGDREPPEMTYLVFGTALPNNQSTTTVKKALQDVVLYLQTHGLPVYRFHSDKGEFYNHQFRNWLLERACRVNSPMA